VHLALIAAAIRGWASPSAAGVFCAAGALDMNRCDRTRCRLNGRLILIEGCEFGLQVLFCAVYAEYMELDATEFEKRIYVKQGAEAYLAAGIARKVSYESAASVSGAGAHCDERRTDPYQAGGEGYGVTQRAWRNWRSAKV